MYITCDEHAYGVLGSPASTVWSTMHLKPVKQSGIANFAPCVSTPQQSSAPVCKMQKATMNIMVSTQLG
jgi:hypothetical protein